jgi:Flp pilus assembly protein TadG
MRSELMRTTAGASGSSGQALIEAAITLLVLVVMMMGIFDYSRSIHAESIITNMSREGANLISRANPNLTGIDDDENVQQVMDLIGQTAQPLDMVHQGMIYIYKVERSGNKYTTTTYNWSSSAMGSKPGASSSLGGAALLDGQTAYGVEVYYKYRSVFLGNYYSPMLKSISIF